MVTDPSMPNSQILAAAIGAGKTRRDSCRVCDEGLAAVGDATKISRSAQVIVDAQGRFTHVAWSIARYESAGCRPSGAIALG
jgi:hypothetical protein